MGVVGRGAPVPVVAAAAAAVAAAAAAAAAAVAAAAAAAAVAAAVGPMAGRRGSRLRLAGGLLRSRRARVAWAGWLLRLLWLPSVTGREGLPKVLRALHGPGEAVQNENGRPLPRSRQTAAHRGTATTRFPEQLQGCTHSGKSTARPPKQGKRQSLVATRIELPMVRGREASDRESCRPSWRGQVLLGL